MAHLPSTLGIPFNMVYFCRMNRIAYLFLLPGIALWTACGEKPGEARTTTPPDLHFQSDTLHFKMDYPAGWTKQFPRDSNSMVVFAEPLTDSADRFQENIQIWTETIPFPLPDSAYKLAAITQIRIANPELKVQKVDDIPVKAGTFSHFHFDFTASDSSRYTVHGYTLLKGPYGYNISLTTEAGQADRYLKQMNQLLNTFQPIP